MRDDKKPARLVFADKPVNRRNARPLPSLPADPRLQRRALKVQARSVLGPGFANSLSSEAASSRHRLPASAVAALAAAAVLAPLAVLSSGVLLSATLGAAAVGAAATGWYLRARSLKRAAPAVVPPIDGSALLALDRMMEAVALELPDDTLQSLLSLKRSLVGAAQACADPTAVDNLGMDDRLYVVECMRRYLPDSMAAYLAIPAAQRGEVIDGGRSATQVFVDQLALLQSQVDALMRKAQRGHGDRLMRQQRFLETKRRGD